MLHSEILCKAGDVDRISLLLASKISNCIWAFKLLDLKTYKKIHELKPQLKSWETRRGSSPVLLHSRAQQEERSLFAGKSSLRSQGLFVNYSSPHFLFLSVKILSFLPVWGLECSSPFWWPLWCCSHAFWETNSLRRTMQIVECSLLHRRAQGSLLLAKDPDKFL